jgi:osmotically-inducible protein OsmY
MNYKRGLLGLGCVILLGGCAGMAAIQSPGRLERYVDCNTGNAMRKASSARDPTTLAIEAEASCAEERRALERTYQKMVGTEQAGVLLDGVRQAAIASNAATIVANGVR